MNQGESVVDDEAAHPSAAVDTALKILLHNAIEEFGQAPRDVYDGVYHLHEMRKRCGTPARRVGRLNYSILSTLVGTFSDSRQLDEFSHHVLVVYPEPLFASLRLDHWVINNRIASQVMN